MFFLPPLKFFREWQIWYYEQRLMAARTKAEFEFIDKRLTNLYLN